MHFSLQAQNRFCTVIKLDPYVVLSECNAGVFKGFLEWRVKWSRIHKLSSIKTYWKIHSMLYAKETTRKMKDDILFDIRNVS
jgi:hypothetical protein